MKNHVSIIGVVPDPTDGTSWYRAANPLGHIKTNAHKYKSIENLIVDFSVYSEISWATLSQFDILFLQRPMSDAHIKIMTKAKQMNIPVWVDYDDDLFSVPKDSSAHEYYSTAEVHERIKWLIKNADVLSVTTPHLKEKLSTLNKNIFVVPNAINVSGLIKRRPNKDNLDKNNLIIWRGSRTHTVDVLSVANQIIEFHDENKDTIFEFIGDRLALVTAHMKDDQFIHTKWMDILDYHQHILSRTPKAVIVPLMMNEFNKSKSNIAWLEASYAGALTIAPDLPEWRKPGVFTYSTQEQFKHALDQVMSLDEVSYLNFIDQAWNYIEKNLTLDIVNQTRADIIASLI